MSATKRPVVECRFLVHGESDGCWNMAVDETLLEEALQSSTPTLRFYQWSKPTLSLGYFQCYEDRHSHRNSMKCAVVRRMTGGGAILHDQELTYSFVWPKKHFDFDQAAGKDPRHQYRIFHETLVEILADFGIESHVLEADDGSRGEQPFLCFKRRGAGDLLVGDHKVAGSAQRRRRGVVMQHGSVLLGTSAAAPELAGLNEIVGSRLSADTMMTAWSRRLEAKLRMRLVKWQFHDQFEEVVSRLASKKYGDSSWTLRR